MNEQSRFESLRKRYKPNDISILFVGESYPQNGSFFYKGDSVLYKLTKEAFDEHLGNDQFDLDYFMDQGCYLFDFCRSLHHMTFKEKVNETAAGIPILAGFLDEYKPEFIICTDNKVFNAIIMANAEIGDLIPESKIFDLPTPFFGNHRYYKEALIEVLKQIDFK